MYSAMDVAKYVIDYSNKSNYAISNLKLQKILYFIQANFLVNLDKACFYEDIEAWNFGPVVPSVYYKYKVFGSSNISSNESTNEKFLLNDRKLIEIMIDECSKYSASQLVDITHNQRPWKNAYRRGANNIITNESILEYFKK